MVDFISKIEGDGASAELTAARQTLASLSVRLLANKDAVFDGDVIAALKTVESQSEPDYFGALDVLKNSNLGQDRIRRVKSKVEPKKKNGLREVQPGEAIGGRLVIDFSGLQNAPMADVLIVPCGYRVMPDLTVREGIPGETVAHGAILITGRTQDIVSRHEGLRLSWTRGNGWRHKIVDRKIAANSRELVTLAEIGFPVTSTTAKEVVDYLAEFEAANLGSLPIAQTTSHQGWQSDGELGFLVGKTFIQPDGATSEAEAKADSLNWQDGQITFRGASAGDEQIVAGYKAAGTMDSWLEAVELASAYPRVLAAVYASFAAPLLTILDCPNFIVDLCSRTSQGKTTTQRLAASIWGVPDERKPAAALSTWGATVVGIERLSAVLCDLPLIMDDTKRAKKAEEIARVLYMVASGRGQQRGAIRGSQVTQTYRTVLISSGEQSITSFTNDGGTKMRVLPIDGAPFGRQNIETGKVVEKINLLIRSNYGLTGRMFVQRLIENKQYWSEIRADYQRRVQAYIESATGERAGRLAAYAGAIAQAATLAHTYLDFPFQFDDPLKSFWKEISTEADDPLGSRRALEYILSWAQSNEHRFLGRELNTSNPPSGGWIGRWDRDEEADIGIYPHHVEDLLKSQKFHPESIFAEWRERGWIESDGKNRFTSRVWVKSENSQRRMILIKNCAIDNNCDDSR